MGKIIVWIIVIAICAELSIVIRNIIAVPAYKRIIENLFQKHNLFLLNDDPDYIKRVTLTSLTVNYNKIDQLIYFKSKNPNTEAYNIMLGFMWDNHVLNLKRNNFLFKTKIPLIYYFKWNLSMMDLIVSEEAIREQVKLEISNYYLK